MIELKNLTFGYKKKKILFNQLNLTIHPGNIYGLLGKNGAGKTTLLKQISGLLYPDKGESLILGKMAGKRDPDTLKELFFLPEEFYLPTISIKTFVNLHDKFYPNFDRSQLEQYLTEFEVDSSQKLGSLSFGQKKKFYIAFGLATNTSILLFDEPTNGLDIPSKSQFRKIIASSMNENRTIIISTHQIRDLSSLIDHIIILESGKIIFDQSTYSISTKVSFGYSREIDQPEVLYGEEILGGQAIIYKRKNTETEIDLELLFNGVIRNPEIINNEFKN
jgi:ABC-2 type transport system ATP-binding protein